MTSYRVRTHPDAATPTGPENLRLLDWIPGSAESTIQLGHRAGSRFFNGWRAPREALGGVKVS